jgi:Mrp family chromosome partitioning ATPase
MSMNVLIDEETQPVLWRGPVIAGAVSQFWNDVMWGDIDVMFVDMPPGTGDVALTVFQQLPIDGIIVVSSPQELVEMIVEKAVKMAELMNVPIFGLVENLSYFECPNCNEKHYIYGMSRIDEIAEKYGISEVARIPIDPVFAALSDRGEIENYKADWLDELSASIL